MSIAVGTGESGVNSYFLHPVPEGAAKILAVGVEAFLVTPGVYDS